MWRWLWRCELARSHQLWLVLMMPLTFWATRFTLAGNLFLMARAGTLATA